MSLKLSKSMKIYRIRYKSHEIRPRPDGFELEIFKFWVDFGLAFGTSGVRRWFVGCEPILGIILTPQNRVEHVLCLYNPQN